MNAALVAIRTVRLPATPDWLLRVVVAERGRFMPWLAVSMIAGVLVYFGLDHEPAAYTGPALVVSAALLRVLLRSRAVLRAMAMALLALAAGFGSAEWATSRAPGLLALPRKAVLVSGTVLQVDESPEGRRLLLGDARLDGGAVLPRTLHIRLRNNDPGTVVAGDAVQARAVLRPPAPPAYPGAWDLQRDEFFSGLGGSGMALRPVEVLAHPDESSLRRWLTNLRQRVAGRIMAELPGTEGAVAATMLTGFGTAIPAADRAAFRESGLAHLLAVAGLHIGIVMGLVMGGTRLALALSEWAALRWPCKQIAAAAALGAGLGYVLLTGMHVPVLRSFAMASLVTLGIVSGRRAISMRGLALAAMAVILYAPQEVVGVSFQMSFAAVLALIAGYEAMNPALARLPRWRTARHLAMLVLTSLLAGGAAAPFGAYYFGRVQLYFILANLAAVPLTALFVMPAGLLSLLLLPFGLERLSLVPMGWGLHGVLLIARAVSALPAASFGVPHIPVWGLGLVALGLAWLGLWCSRLRLAGAVAIAAGLLAGLVSPPADLLVSSDARLIAWRSPAFLQTRPGYSKFDLDLWAQYWAETPSGAFPEDGTPGAIRCDIDGCRLERAGAAILLARSQKPMDCTGAGLVVSAEPSRDVCPNLPKIDRFSVWRHGAYAVWLHGGEVEMVSDRAYRGQRPWVPGPLRGGETTLPLAATE